MGFFCPLVVFLLWNKNLCALIRCAVPKDSVSSNLCKCVQRLVVVFGFLPAIDMSSSSGSSGSAALITCAPRFFCAGERISSRSKQAKLRENQPFQTWLSTKKNQITSLKLLSVSLKNDIWAQRQDADGGGWSNMLVGLMVDGVWMVEKGGHDGNASSDKYEFMNQERIHMATINVRITERGEQNWNRCLSIYFRLNNKILVTWQSLQMWK